MKEETNITAQTKQPEDKSNSGRVVSYVPFNINGITLIEGDCQTQMLSLPPFDWVITDPPFNADYGFANDNMSEQDFYRFTTKWIRKAERLVKQGLVIIVDPKYCEPFYKIVSLPYHHTYTWFKRNAMRGMQGGFANKTEIIVWTERKPEKVEQFPNDVWEIPLIPRDVDHPTPKPIKLLELILRKFTYEGETILDPFAGSGSTLRAAKELGRKATGIEINNNYCKTIIAELSQTEMFT